MAAQMIPVASSTSGYIGEIGSAQLRHFPRSTSQESTGMLSYGRSPAPQRGHREGGRTTDCFGSAPQRTMQTLRKLPKMRPKSAAIRMPASGGSASAITQDLVQEDGRRDRDVEGFGAGDEPDCHPATRRGGEARPDAGAFVADDEGETVGALGWPGQRLAVGGGHPDRQAAGPGPLEESRFVGGDGGDAEQRPHAPADHLRVRQLRGALQRDHPGGPQRVPGAEQRADVARVLHGVQDEHRAPPVEVDVMQPPSLRLDDRHYALRVLGVRQLLELGITDLLETRSLRGEGGLERLPARGTFQRRGYRGAPHRDAGGEGFLDEAHPFRQRQAAALTAAPELEIPNGGLQGAAHMNALDRSIAVVTLAVIAVGCAPSVQQEVEIGNQYSAEIDRTMPLVT